MKVVTAVLTHDRPNELRTLLGALQAQTVLSSVVVVDSGSQSAQSIVDEFNGVIYSRSYSNLGGAGGFSLAILLALATGAEWIWILDDDGCPVGNRCLETLMTGARQYDLAAVSPIITVPHDAQRLAFPMKADGRFTYDVERLRSESLIPDLAYLFNGALIQRQVFFRIGLPQVQLFIRGDEVDFLLRLRRNGVRFGTLTSAAVSHPSGERERIDLIKGRLFVLVPETAMKRYYFFRNRGYLARRYRRVSSFLMDILLYPYVFIVVQRFNVSGFRSWRQAYWDGLTYRFDRSPIQPGS